MRLDLSSFDQEERGALEALGLRPGTLGSGPVCPDPSLLVAADEGVLDAVVADQVRAHVAICPACTMLSADLASVFAEAETGDAEVRIAARIAEAKPKSRGLAWGMATGGLLIAASLAALMVAQQDVQIPIVPFSAARADRTAALPSVFDAEMPLAEPADVELTLRGGAPSRPVVEAPGRPATAATDEAEWRRAVTFVQTGDVTSARRVLTDLCAHPTLPGALACAGQIELDREGKR